MTAPISNEPTTTRLHHYAGHYSGTWEHPDAVAAREAEQARQQSLRGLALAEWADAWIADLERTAASSTLRKRRSDLRRHILPYLGD